MSREGWRRLVWVLSLVATLVGITIAMIRRGVEWGINAAP